jgi:hypothetical protein
MTMPPTTFPKTIRTTTIPTPIITTSREIGVCSPTDPRQKSHGIQAVLSIPSSEHPQRNPSLYRHHRLPPQSPPHVESISLSHRFPFHLFAIHHHHENQEVAVPDLVALLLRHPSAKPSAFKIPLHHPAHRRPPPPSPLHSPDISYSASPTRGRTFPSSIHPPSPSSI